METLPEKPAGSVIEEVTDPSGVTLSWPLPSPGLSRYAAVPFLVVWLCGWAAGWAAAAKEVARGGAPPFLVFWLCAWTAGGLYVLWSLWAVLRPARPESVRLEGDVLRYDPGRAPYNLWEIHNRWGLWGRRPPPAPPPAPAVEVARSDVRGFDLVRIGDRQRLSFDRGADRIEIGAGLREPEREWLFVVLQQWHAPGRARGAAPVPARPPEPGPTDGSFVPPLAPAQPEWVFPFWLRAFGVVVFALVAACAGMCLLSQLR